MGLLSEMGNTIMNRTFEAQRQKEIAERATHKKCNSCPYFSLDRGCGLTTEPAEECHIYVTKYYPEKE